MRWMHTRLIRKDSRSIALLAVFSSMAIALEIVPWPGVLDIPVLGVPGFNINWSGIPVVIVFFGLGFAYSLISVGAMWAAIAYRNFTGAAFKGCAEFFTVLGLVVAKLATAKWKPGKKISLAIYAVSACLFRAVGMYFTNIQLLPIFYGMPIEVAAAASALYVPWNIVQAIINVVLGGLLYFAIPERLAIEAGLGDQADRHTIQELPTDAVDEEAHGEQ